jgi:hypothetical protein
MGNCVTPLRYNVSTVEKVSAAGANISLIYQPQEGREGRRSLA